MAYNGGYYQQQPQQPQNIYQQLGKPQPQPHLQQQQQQQQGFQISYPVSSFPLPRPLSSFRPPPVSHSAALAQQVQQTQVQQQSPTRRPLPQPSPGANAKTPALPAVLHRVSTSTPFSQIPPTLSKTPSPTRIANGRPLPTPQGNKRFTVDLGKLPSLTQSQGLAFPTSSSPTKLGADQVAARTILSRTSSYALNGPNADRSASPPKRRTSPPRFISDSSSSSPIKETSSTAFLNSNVTTGRVASPTKSTFTFTSTATSPSKDKQSTTSSTPVWKRTIPEVPAPVWGYAAGMVKEPHPKPQSQLQGKTTTTTVTTAVAKGVVVGVGEGGSKKLLKKKKEKEKEKEGKRGKEKEKTGRDEKGKESWWARGKGEVGQQGQKQRQVQSHPYQPFQTGKQVHGSSSQVYPYPHQQQQVQVQTAYMNANAYPRATGGYGSRRKDETEEEDTGEEEEEETGEETGEEGKGGAWTPVRPGSGSGHSWYYTQPLVDETSGSESGRDRGRSDGRSGNRGKHERYSYGDDDDDEEEETDEETPRRTHIRTRSNPISTLSSTPTSRKLPTTKRGMVSRVKEKVDPYAGYEDVSPIGVGNLAKAKARVRPRSFHVSMQEEEEEEERPPRRGRGSQPPKQHQQRERERDWHHEEVPTHTQTQAQAQAHQRSRSAIEEREKQVLIARARARSVSRPRAGGSGRGGHENVDEEEEEEEEEGVLGLAYDDEHEREEEGVFRGRGGVSNKSTTTGTGRAGLPQPPAMVRDGAVGITGNLAGGRKIQGGPRWKGSSSASLLYGDDGTGIGEGGDGRGGNSGGSGEYGYGYGRQHQRQGQGRVAILQSAPGAVEGRGREGEAGVGRAWPADLPRLPRTPGGTGTEEERGNYFDLRSQSRESASHNQTQQGGRAVSEFVTRAGGPRSQSQGLPPSAGATRSASRDQGFTSGHYQRGGRGSKSELDGLNLGLGRDDLDLDDPPPRASVVRTPSPGGYVLQKREDGEERGQGLFGGGYHRQREQQQEQEQGYGAPMNEQGQRQRQQQARPQSQMYGHPPPPQHPQQRHQVIGSRSPFVGNQQHQQLPPPQHPFQPRRKQPQTPAPPPTVGIESPHPVGGRDRLADMHKLDWDSNHGSDHERFSANGDVGEDAGAGASSSPMMTPRISINAATGGGGGGAKTIPTIQIGESEFDSSPRMGHKAPVINVSVDHGSPRKQPRDMSNNNHNNGSSGGGGPRIQIFDVPGVSISGPEFDDDEQAGPVVINVSGPGPGPGDEHHHQQQQKAYSSAHDNSHSHVARRQQPNPPPQSHFQHPQGRPPSQLGPGFGGQARSRPGGGGGGLACSGCHGQITNGRIVSAMGLRWHPTCFKCSVCSTPLEHVSSYEHEGRPYCHLDYHESFAPRCYSCETAIIDEQFISLDDPALGKRTYHTQHFFCSECGDPFLDPSAPLSTDENGELALSGDGEFEGFTVYKGYPYCEACHVRLRLPKCKRCKKSIRDHEDAVEALGGKWCWACFVCVSCNKPFEDPSFFQRGDEPYCEHCFSVLLRNEI